MLIKTAPTEHLVGVDTVLRYARDRGAPTPATAPQGALELQRVLAVVAARIRGNDRLKICVHNPKFRVQALFQNSIMLDAGQTVQTALGTR